MKDEDRKKIEKIMAGMQCQKNFKCAKSGYVRLCKAKDIGLEDYIICLEGNPSACSFALSFGLDYYCRCPLRMYISKELKK